MKSLSISPGAILLFSAVYFFGGAEELAALLLSVLAHEAGHIAAIRLFGGRLHGLNVSASGLCIRYTGAGTVISELICALSGPAAGFVLAYAASHLGGTLMLETAGLSLVLSVYNLLPALPLDGGRALECILTALADPVCAGRVMSIIGFVTGTALIALGLYFMHELSGAAVFISGIIVLFAQTGIVKSLNML